MKRFRTTILVALALGALMLAQPALAGGLTLPSDLIEVEDEAFFGDSSLTEIVLSEGLESIGSKAFAGTGLTSVTLPSSLEEIKDDAFDGPDKVSVSAEQYSYAYRWAVRNGYIVPFTWVENSDGTVTITGYTDDDTDLDIPAKIEGKTVTGIGAGAFRGNTNLTEVTLPDTLTQVGAEAFYGCTGLSRPSLPFGLREIGDRAFYGATGVSLRLPRTIVSIGEDAFTGFRFMNVNVGSYGNQWALAMLEQDSSLYYVQMYTAIASVSTEVAFEDERVTCSAFTTDEYTQSVQWQRSFDGSEWADCEGEGATAFTYSFIASGENCGCQYRLATTDPSGTYYSPTVSIGYLANDFHFNSAYVNGTVISLDWGSSWEGIVYTLYMTGPDGNEQILAEDTYDGFYDSPVWSRRPLTRSVWKPATAIGLWKAFL